MRNLICLLIIIMFMASSVFAQDDVVVETSPRDPVKGEVFQIIFKCQTKGASEPSITFKPDGFEVLGKHVQGLSTKTVYQNGTLTTQRELLIVYEARADRVGRISLRDVIVKIDGKTIREPAVGIDVLEARREPTVVFLEADVPKKEVYEGEGITVRYFIYTKVTLQSFDIKKYPKLDGFMKRYLNESENPQRVSVNGELFRRSQIYTARLYPEKTGTLIVDPMDISTTYTSDPFGNLGFAFGSGMRDLKTRTISSAPVKVVVKPLPSAGKPASFKGLVGKHKVELKVGRSNLLVNEPLEAKLTVSGTGNLENMEAPALWDVPQLEKFDAKSDLGLVGGENAIKTFEYTYLGKAPGEVKSVPFELSYFDPETNRYETFKQEIPLLKVAGIANPTVAPMRDQKNEKQEVSDLKEKSDAPVELQSVAWWSQMGFWWSLLAGVLILVAAWKGRDLVASIKSNETWIQEIKTMQHQQVSNSSLLKVFYHLAKGENDNLEKIIQSSNLSEQTKSYYLDIVQKLMRQEYGKESGVQVLRLEGKYARELKKEIRRKYADS
jgi:hypothetical protein